MYGTRPSTPSGTSLPRAGRVALAVAIAGPGPHRPQRTHAAIGLEGAALVDDRLSRALGQPGQQAAEHDRMGPRRQGLGDVARVADAAVGDDRHAAAGGRPGRPGKWR